MVMSAFFFSLRKKLKLYVIFSQCVRSAAGFTSLVPASVASKFCGFDKLRIYLKYWFGSRSADAYLKDNFYIVKLFEEEKKQVRISQEQIRVERDHS